MGRDSRSHAGRTGRFLLDRVVLRNRIPRCRVPRPWNLRCTTAANQAAQVSLVSGDATAHEDSVLSVDVDDVDAAYALAQATGLLPDYDKCRATSQMCTAPSVQEADR